MVRPRYSPLLFSFILFPVFGLWGYDSIGWKSHLPAVQVEVEEATREGATFRKDYDFTADWFSFQIPIWEKVLAPYVGKPNVRYLEIGLYEGMSALWMLENVLTHETAHVTGIDPILGDYGKRLKSNLERSGYARKVSMIEGFSQLVLRDLSPGSYDIIYIDGSHASKDVLEDAVLSWRLLREGGVLIFDDYRWFGADSPCEFDSETDHPKVAIDSFTRCFWDELEVVHNAYQLILRKNL